MSKRQRRLFQRFVSPRYRVWLVVVLVATVSITFVGAALYTQSAYPGNSGTQIGLGTMLGGWANSSEISGVSLNIGVFVPEKAIVVVWEWKNITPGYYEFVTVLPVQVISSEYLEPGIWDYHNIPGNGSVATASLKWNSTGNSSADVSAIFYTHDNLVSEDRGNYQLYLPLGEEAPAGINELLNKLQNSSNPFKIRTSGLMQTVTVGIPDGITPNLIYPPSAIPARSRLPIGPNEAYYTWSLNPSQALILDYFDGAKVDQLATEEFLGGLLLGVGVSGVIAVILDFLKTIRGAR